jgi:hypothetical protein
MPLPSNLKTPHVEWASPLPSNSYWAADWQGMRLLVRPSASGRIYHGRIDKRRVCSHPDPAICRDMVAQFDALRVRDG